jgi:hypothetical protein
MSANKKRAFYSPNIFFHFDKSKLIRIVYYIVAPVK